MDGDSNDPPRNGEVAARSADGGVDSGVVGPTTAFGGPSQAQLDLTLGRVFPLLGQHRLDVRWEIYNVLNTPVFGNPASTFAANGFGTAGQITRCRSI